MLSNGRDLYAVRCFKKHESHYTLYYYELPAGIIICSEPIESQGLDHARRMLLANNCLLRISGNTPGIEEIKF